MWQGYQAEALSRLSRGRARVATFWWRSYSRAPSFSMSSTGIILSSGRQFASVAVDEVGESDSPHSVLPCAMVVIDALRPVWCGRIMAIARVQITKSSDVFVVVDSVVSGLAVLEPVRGGHFSDPPFIVPADESVDWVAVEGESDYRRVFGHRPR